MKNISVMMLDDSDKQVIDALIGFGINRKLATVVVFLGDEKYHSSKQIESGAGLAQPEVSLGIGEATKHGWISRATTPSDRKPVTSYRLAIPLASILTEIENDVIAKQSDIKSKFANLKKAIA